MWGERGLLSAGQAGVKGEPGDCAGDELAEDASARVHEDCSANRREKAIARDSAVDLRDHPASLDASPNPPASQPNAGPRPKSGPSAVHH